MKIFNHLKKLIDKELFYQSLIVLIVGLLYSYSWNYPIYDVWDDQVYILYNKHLIFSPSNFFYWFTHKSIAAYIPITMISYMFDYSIWGLNSLGYHLQNIFWHIVATIAIYQCFRLFKIKSWIAFFLCLIFAVHPQRVESVVWLSERKDVLCAAFYFLSIFFYVKNYNKKFSITAFILFILAMLSKPMAVSLPIVLVVYEIWRRAEGREQEEEVGGRWSVVGGQLTVSSEEKKAENSNQLTVSSELKTKNKNKDTAACRDTRCVSKNCLVDDKNKKLKSVVSGQWPAFCGYIFKLFPYFIVIFLLVPITILAQTDFEFVSPYIPIYEKIYIALFNIYWYFKETLFSTDLNPLYPTATLFYSIIEVIVFYTASFVLALFLFYKKRNLFLHKIVPLVLCFIISLLPVIGLIKLGAIDRADRYSYIPSVFIWFGIGIILNKIFYRKDLKIYIFSNKKFIFLILAAYLSVLIINNIKYQKVWENKFSLFNYSVQCIPFSHIAIIYLIEMEYARHNYYAVLKLADTLDSNPNLSVTANYYKSLVEFKLNKKSALKSLIEVEPKLRKGIKFKVIHNRYVILLGYIINKYDLMGNRSKILEYLNKMLNLPNLNSVRRFLCLGLKAYYLKNYKESISWYKKALEIRPGNKLLIERLKQASSAVDILGTAETQPK